MDADAEKKRKNFRNEKRIKMHKNNFLILDREGKDCAETTPQNTSKSHLVSHHSAVAMDTHIKLRHLPCPPFIAAPHPPKSNPV